MDRWTRLRWQIRLLAVLDWLLGTHLVERKTSHWRQEIEAMQAQIASLEASLTEMDASHKAILRHMCLSYLEQRQVQCPQDWLHFDPRQPTQETAIDLLSKALVAPHWARWRVTPVQAGDVDIYTYDLLPDWTALHQDALDHAAILPSSLLEWLALQVEKNVPSQE